MKFHFSLTGQYPGNLWYAKAYAPWKRLWKLRLHFLQSNDLLVTRLLSQAKEAKEAAHPGGTCFPMAKCSLSRRGMQGLFSFTAAVQGEEMVTGWKGMTS